MNLKSIALLSAVALVLPAVALAGPITVSGNFAQDEDVVLIPFTVPTLGVVTIRTTSFADGSTGFEPVLTLYDSAGNLLLQDATGGTVPAGCGLRSIDPTSGYCLDALIQSPLNAGSYTLALTEWDNIPGGPTLADGFPQTGNGNFTGPESPGLARLLHSVRREPAEQRLGSANRWSRRPRTGNGGFGRSSASGNDSVLPQVLSPRIGPFLGKSHTSVQTKGRKDDAISSQFASRAGSWCAVSVQCLRRSWSLARRHLRQLRQRRGQFRSVDAYQYRRRKLPGCLSIRLVARGFESAHGVRKQLRRRSSGRRF